MGKILKYCSSCDEGFAERFTFCPDCGASLQAYEMNPLGNSETVEVPSPAILAQPEAVEPDAQVVEAAPVEVQAIEIDEPAVVEPIEYEAASYGDGPDATEIEVESPALEAQEIEVESSAPADEEIYEDVPAYAAGSYYQTPEMSADDVQTAYAAPNYMKDADGGFYVTVIQEKNGSQRNALLLGAAIFMVSVMTMAWVVSLFQKDLGVGSIGSEQSIAMLLEDVPMVIDEETPEEKKDDDEGGGGGGGGREEKTPVSQGDLADQSPTPTRPPNANIPRLTNPSLELPPPQTQGNMKFDKKYDKWGDPNAAPGLPSNGPGTGGGMGSGTGTGQGSGIGTGAGSGIGSGFGGGVGNGNGNGTGSGTGGPPPAVKPVTVNYRIISTPKATYTDEARQKNIQGAVRLKITLLASGAIGPITPVTRLPHGLTEQAIAAARRIQFEPKKVNGVPQSVVITREYTFTIY